MGCCFKSGPQGPMGPPGNNTNYRGVWTGSYWYSSNPVSGDVWIWNGGDATTLDNVQWGDANGEVVNNGDQIIYSTNSFDVIPAIPSGVADIVAGDGIAVDSTDPNSPIVSTTFFIEKGGNGMPYDVSLLFCFLNMAMQDSDNLIVGRGNASYKISYEDFVVELYHLLHLSRLVKVSLLLTAM